MKSFRSANATSIVAPFAPARAHLLTKYGSRPPALPFDHVRLEINYSSLYSRSQTASPGRSLGTHPCQPVWSPRSNKSIKIYSWIPIADSSLPATASSKPKPSEDSLSRSNGFKSARYDALYLADGWRGLSLTTQSAFHHMMRNRQESNTRLSMRPTLGTAPWFKPRLRPIPNPKAGWRSSVSS